MLKVELDLKTALKILWNISDLFFLLLSVSLPKFKAKGTDLLEMKFEVCSQITADWYRIFFKEFFNLYKIQRYNYIKKNNILNGRFSIFSVNVMHLEFQSTNGYPSLLCYSRLKTSRYSYNDKFSRKYGAFTDK